MIVETRARLAIRSESVLGAAAGIARGHVHAPSQERTPAADLADVIAAVRAPAGSRALSCEVGIGTGTDAERDEGHAALLVHEVGDPARTLEAAADVGGRAVSGTPDDADAVLIAFAALMRRRLDVIGVDLLSCSCRLRDRDRGVAAPEARDTLASIRARFAGSVPQAYSRGGLDAIDALVAAGLAADAAEP